VNYRTEDFVAHTLEITGGLGADVIFDPVGGDVFQRSRRCIAVDGRIVLAGFAGGQVQDIRATSLLFGNYSVMGLYVGAYRRGPQDIAMLHDVHAEVFELVRNGKVRPFVERIISLEDAPAALDALGGRRVMGKVLVRQRSGGPRT
jgi:NADPH2:quinone reductase